MSWIRAIATGAACGLLVYILVGRYFGLYPGHRPMGEVKGTLERVIDGDTIRVNGLAVRLYGIDAPELAQACNGGRTPCGWISAEHLYPVTGEHVSCTVKAIDRYRRPVAVCLLDDDTDLSAFQALAGQALALRRYSTNYVVHEDAARSARAGLWSGTFETPWAWRRQYHHLKGGTE